MVKMKNLNLDQKLKTFKKVAEALNQSRVNWGVGASLLLWFKGIVEEFDDIDLLVNLDSVLELERILKCFGNEKPQSLNAHFQSDFFKTYIIDELEFDVIGGFRIIEKEKHYFPFIKAYETYDLDGISIPLDNLTSWIDYYSLMSRPLKAKLIKDYYFNKLLDELKNQSEEHIKKYQSRVIPNIDSSVIIGVSLPKLRKIAKQIAKKDFELFKEINQPIYLENILLEGMAIGYYETDLQTKWRLIEAYLPLINNWETCDTLVASLEIAKDDLESVFKMIKTYANSKEPYRIRFMLVMMIDNFNNHQYHAEIFKIINGLKSDEYYVKMAIAWLLTEIYIKDQELVLTYLKQSQLDDFTYNKTLQKICESLKVDKETKKMIRQLKR